MGKQFWRFVKNEAGDSELFLEGVIAQESWFDDEVTPKQFREQLDSHPGNITVRINSPGGDAFAGVQIYNMLKDRKDTVTTSVAQQAVAYPLDPVLVQVIALDASDSSTIEGARLRLEADAGGPLPALESVTITRSGSTASVAHTAHGMAEGDTVIIRGAVQDEYNGSFVISNVTTNAYDYTVSGTPTTPATGTITASAMVLTGLTDVSGVISTDTFAYTADQPVIGTIRKGSAASYYKPALVSGTITSTGLILTVYMIGDE